MGNIEWRAALLLSVSALSASAGCAGTDADAPRRPTVDSTPRPPETALPTPTWTPPVIKLATPTEHPLPTLFPTATREYSPTPEVVPQPGDVVGIKGTDDPSKPEYVLIRQGVGILPISAGAYQKSIPPNARHTLFAHERASYGNPSGERIEWTIAQDRTRIQSQLFDVNGKPKGSPGTHAHAQANRTFAGFSIDSDALMGVAAEGRVIRFFEAYPNPHHAETAEDEATKQVLQRAAGILWIQFATGEFRTGGVAAVISPPHEGPEALVTLYRINRLARNHRSQFSPEEQAQMAGTVHELNYVMMLLNKKDPQRSWIPITRLPLSAAQQLINVYVVSR